MSAVPLADEVHELARERDALILAHNYQAPPVQEAADFVGDSLALARIAAGVENSVIVLAGVLFMAETAKILSPEKVVVLPDPDAGCPMADMMTAAQAEEWRAADPGVPLVTYVNSSAEVKARSDVCCTSSNAVQVVRSLDAPKVLFGPDRNLASWVARHVPDTEVVAWDGCCIVHDLLSPETARATVEAHPDAEVLAHPECLPEVLDLADHVLSTSGMIERVAVSHAEEFVVFTEGGLLHGLAKAAPGKRFHQPDPPMVCADMKLTTLEKVRDSVRDLEVAIDVDEDVREAALAAVERMVAVG